MIDASPLKSFQTATPAAHSLHNNFVVSVRDMKKSLVRAAFYLAEIADRRIHRMMGFYTAAEYAARAGGLSCRQSRELIRVGRHLRRLPELAAAVEKGSLSWSKARLIVARATPETENDWLEFARKTGRREIELRINNKGFASNQSGGVSNFEADHPSIPDDVVTGNAKPEERTGAPQIAGHLPGDDGAPIPRDSSPGGGCCATGNLPAENEDRSPQEKDRLPVTISFSSEQYARWEAIVAALRKAGMGDDLPELHLAGLDQLLDESNASNRRKAVPAYFITLIRCPACGRGLLNTSRGSHPAPEALLQAAACDAMVEREENGRILRSAVVPPQLRRRVLRRDLYRCQAKNCNHTQFLEIHHKVPVSHGGQTKLGNLITLCRGCHRALHEQEESMKVATRSGGCLHNDAAQRHRGDAGRHQISSRLD